MRRLLTLAAATLALGMAMPAVAQDEADLNPKAQAQMDKVASLLGGLFQAEPLTAEQEERLPEASAVVAQIMPDGFYSKMMREMMDKTMRPMMSAFATPEFILGARLDVDQETLAGLDEAAKLEAVEMLDPAYDRRVDAIVNVMTGKMGGMFAQMEDPMREGLSKAYAVRFDEAQLADIAAFFATPTGSTYASQSMALFMDPQVMQASMQAIPAMMSGFGDMESAMKQAMDPLPKERAYKDLTAQERTRLAQILGVRPAKLADVVKPPKPMDSGSSD